MRRQATELPSAPLEVIEVGGRSFSDPFDIPAALSSRIDPDQYPQIFGMIEARYRRLLRKAFQGPGPLALLLCDRRVIAEATTPEEFGFDMIDRVEREHDRVCFIYSRGDLVEESAWSGLGSDDAYPTVRVWVAPAATPESGVRSIGAEVEADFDTGNPRHPKGFCAFEDSVRREARIAPRAHTQGTHLSGTYWFTGVPVLLAVADEQGKMRVHGTAVRFVRDWASSPLVWANPARRGYVGREILFGLRLLMVLDSAGRRTRVELA